MYHLQVAPIHMKDISCLTPSVENKTHPENEVKV